MKTTLSIRAAALAFGLTAACGAARAGIYAEIRMTAGSTDAGGSRISSMTAWADGPRAKIDFGDRGQPPLFTPGSYLLVPEEDGKIYVVRPAEETVSEVDLEQVFAMAGTILNAVGGLVKMEFDDFSHEKVLEEPGEPILGYATTHYRYVTSYAAKMRVLGITRENRSETEQEFWCADDLEAAGLRTWLRPDRWRTGIEQIDELIRQQGELFDCLPLRARTVGKSIDQKGREVTTTSLTEATVLEEQNIPADTFRYPATYELTPFIVPGLDQIFRQDDEESSNASSGESEEADSEGQRPFRRFRDLIPGR